MRRDLHSVADVLVSYNAGAMPLEAIEQIHNETVEQVIAGTTSSVEGFQILDLLLKVSSQKIAAISERTGVS
jgi:hypothetical protein